MLVAEVALAVVAPPPPVTAPVEPPAMLLPALPHALTVSPAPIVAKKAQPKPCFMAA